MANRKISDLTALTATAVGDLLPIVDISEATAADKNKKITVEKLFQGIPGNVGVGVTPSAWSGLTSLSIGSTGSSIASASNDNLYLTSGAYYNGTNWIYKTTSQLVSSYQQLSGIHRWNIAAGGTAGNAITFTQAMTLDASGRLGIGTTGPGDVLDTAAGNYRGITIKCQTTAHRPTLSFFNTTDSLAAYIQATGNSLAFGRMAIDYGGHTEALRIDSSGRLLVGTSTARANFFNSTVSPLIQQEGVSGSSRFASITYGSNTEDEPIFILGKHRGASVGGTTVVNSGDGFGKISFQGSDGTEFVEGAAIRAEVDGTPGADDMPGRLVFSTTADGAAAPTERYRITNDGVMCHDQPTPATYAAAATLTVADLKTGIITYTGGAATLTLPTGTLTEGGFAGIYTNMTFEWSVINTGAGICTIGAGTAHTIVGSGSVAIGASARFTSRRTAANTFVSYRLS
jgi:hypothetical protein